MRRFSREDDERLSGAYRRGTSIKRICEELGREPSSVKERVRVLKLRGALRDRVDPDRVEFSVRIGRELQQRLKSQAAGSGRSLSKHVDYILGTWVFGQR